MSGAEDPKALWLACLCAAWCRTCDGYAPVFESVAAEFGGAIRTRWIDIEDEADRLGDLDIETFPTLLLADAAGVRFFGPLTPEPGTLRRVLRAAVASAPVAAPPEVHAVAAQLRAENRGT